MIAVPKSVLFVCSANVVRSPMAAALLKLEMGKRIYVCSAGVTEGSPDGFVTSVMGELGIDLSHHEPVLLDDLDDASFDLAITMAPDAHHRALQWASTRSIEIEYWPTEDPTVVGGSRDARLDAYRGLRDRLQQRIHDRFAVRT